VAKKRKSGFAADSNDGTSLTIFSTMSLRAPRHTVVAVQQMKRTAATHHFGRAAEGAEVR